MFVAVCSLLAATATAPPAQSLERRSVEPLVSVPLEGFVFEPDGSPAEGIVVVSSAGGKAVTDLRGWYHFEVLVPLDAQSLRVTAVGARDKNVASTSVRPGAPVGPLTLALDGSCSPSWLPTTACLRLTALWDPCQLVLVDAQHFLNLPRFEQAELFGEDVHRQ